MEKSQKKYWAVFEVREVLFEGSFGECWRHLTENYADRAVSWLSEHGVRVARSG